MEDDFEVFEGVRLCVRSWSKSALKNLISCIATFQMSSKYIEELIMASLRLAEDTLQLAVFPTITSNG